MYEPYNCFFLTKDGWLANYHNPFYFSLSHPHLPSDGRTLEPVRRHRTAAVMPWQRRIPIAIVSGQQPVGGQSDGHHEQGDHGQTDQQAFACRRMPA